MIFRKTTNKILIADLSPKIIELAYFEVFVSKFKLLNSACHICNTGDPQDAPEATDFILDFMRRNRIKENNVILSLSPSLAGIKYLDFPKMSDKEILEAGKSELHDKVPFDLNDALTEWRVVKTYADENGLERIGVIFIVAERKLIDHHLALFKTCRLNVVELTSRSLCFANILEQLDDNTKILATLNIGYKDSNINLYVDNKLHFTRVIPVGIEKLAGQGGLDLSAEAAGGDSSALLEHLVYKAADLLKDGKDAAGLPHLEALARQIRVSFEYFQMASGLNYPSQLYLTGFATLIDGLNPFFRKKLEMETSGLPVPANIEINPSAGPARTDGTMKITYNTLGAVLREANSFNLIGVDIIQKKIDTRITSFLQLVALLMGAVIFTLICDKLVQLRYHQMRLAKKLEYYYTIMVIDDLRAKQETYLEFVTTLQQAKGHPDGLLMIIGAKAPKSIYLNLFEYDKPAGQVTLSGYFIKTKAQDDALANFVEQLNTVSFLSGFKVLTLEDTGGRIKFTSTGIVGTFFNTDEDS